MDEDEIRLAETLHSVKCHMSHEDQCGWFWENTNGERWNGWAHTRYLKWAQRIRSRLSDLPDEKIIEVVKILG